LEKVAGATAGRKSRGSGKRTINGDLMSIMSDEVLTSFPEPLMLYNSHGAIVYVNGAATESLGFDPTGMLRDEMTAKVKLHAGDGTEIEGRDTISELASHGRTIRNIYYSFRRPGGDVRRTIGSAAPIEYAGETIGMIITWHDVTEQIKSEELVILARNNLEKLLEERSLELFESQKSVQRQNRLSDLGKLAATVAHELRNPLGVIRTAAYNLRRKNTDPALNGHLANIDKKIEESSRIINNLLTFSRLPEPKFLSVKLADLLIECIDSAKKAYRKVPVRIQRRLRRLGSREIDADPDQIREVFLNLLSNAIEASKDKGLVVVTAFCDDEGNVLVEVKDEGIGIGESSIKRVFDPFYTKKAKGAGLGLSICRELVELHGGSISIISKQGSGTTLTVKLPMEREK
jgi:PAS domain S-box-containing protein